VNDQNYLGSIDSYWKRLEKSDENSRRVTGDDDQLAVAPASKGIEGTNSLRNSRVSGRKKFGISKDWTEIIFSCFSLL
jgi:hypothetical protein